ncbi:retrovirus-related pol polyprotein from transposon TNT 1-94 [Tanacetum coccineum]
MENQSDVQNHLVEIQADDHDLLVNSDNENDNMLGYESEKYSNDEDADGTNHAEDADGTNHSDLKLVKRGITRLYKFRREYEKPGGIKIKVTFDALNRVSGLHKALFSSFLGDLVRGHISLKILSWKKRYFDVDMTVRKLYETLSTFLIQNKFSRGRIDNTLFIYKSKGEVLLVQVYVDDIIFGSTGYKLCKQFEKLMTKKIEMSMIGELTYFLGLQIKQDDKGISICQEQYTRNLLKKYEISDSSLVKTPMVPSNNLAKAEYVAAAGCCASILWMKSQLSDYDIHYKMVPIFCDNTSAIAISNNPVLHSRTKHIDIRYHFIRDHILKGDIELYFIPTKYQLADIFTKPLDEPTFTRLKAKLGMLNIDKSVSQINHV